MSVDAQLLDRLRRRLQSWCPDADDVLADGLLCAVEADRLDIGGRDAAWFSGVLRNRYRMRARAAVRYRERLTRLAPPTPNSFGLAAAVDSPLAWCRSWPRHLRLVAILALSGHDRESIARILQLSPAALRQRLSLCRQRFRAWDGQKQDIAKSWFMYSRSGLARLAERLGPAASACAQTHIASVDPDGHGFLLTKSPSVATAGK